MYCICDLIFSHFSIRVLNKWEDQSWCSFVLSCVSLSIREFSHVPSSFGSQSSCCFDCGQENASLVLGGPCYVSLAHELWKLALAAASFVRMKRPHLWWLFVPEIPPCPHPRLHRGTAALKSLCTVSQQWKSPFWFPGIKGIRLFAA